MFACYVCLCLCLSHFSGSYCTVLYLPSPLEHLLGDAAPGRGGGDDSHRHQDDPEAAPGGAHPADQAQNVLHLVARVDVVACGFVEKRFNFTDLELYRCDVNTLDAQGGCKGIHGHGVDAHGDEGSHHEEAAEESRHPGQEEGLVQAPVVQQGSLERQFPSQVLLINSN